MRKVLILGGTGQVGRPLIRRLLKQGWWIRAISRRPENLPDGVQEPIKGSLDSKKLLLEACEGIDTVWTSVGASLDLTPKFRSPGFEEVDFRGNLSLLRAAQEAGVKKIGYLSVLPTSSTQGTRYIKAHQAFEAALQASGLNYVIVQPTGFFSAFDSFLGIAKMGVAPQIGTGQARTNPIHVEDLADVCYNALSAQEGIIPAGGPIVYTRNEIFELAFEAVHKRPRFVRIPAFMLATNRMLIRPVDRRLSDVLDFLSKVSQSDAIGPAYGSQTLDAYFKDLLNTSHSLTS